MMELKQMIKYRVFRHIGAFSIDLDSPKQTLRSLRYAVESMRRDQACLFIFPEGKINAPSDELPPFEPGVGWLVKQCVSEGLNVDVVPISIYIHEMTASKPVLWVEIGAPVDFSVLHLKREDSREKGDRSKRGKAQGIDDGSVTREITQRIHSDLERQLKASKERAYKKAFG
jgi:1-acyl-sn-glycerol-3-phosphate acyltransferase